MCPVSLAGHWIEQAELTWGEGLRIHQAPTPACVLRCLDVDMLQLLLACMSRRRSVCKQAGWLARGDFVAFLRVTSCSYCMLGLHACMCQTRLGW